PEVIGAPAGYPPIDPPPSYHFDSARFGVSGVFDGTRLNFPVIGFTNATGAGVNFGPVPVGEPTDTQSRLTFGITDNASGESASAEFTGKAVMEYRYDPATGQANPEAVDLRIDGLSNYVWGLGGNTFRVTLYDAFEGPNGGQDQLFASVVVS